MDEDGLYRIKGRKNSDHNTMLISINTEFCYKKNKLLKSWKLNNKEGWRQYNAEVQETFKTDKEMVMENT